MMKVKPTNIVAVMSTRWMTKRDVMRPVLSDASALQPPEMKIMNPTTVATMGESPIIDLI